MNMLNAEELARALSPVAREPEAKPEDYDARYIGLRAELIANAEHVAAKYQSLGERYLDLANKVRAQGNEAADRHVRDLIMLDEAEALLGRVE